MWYMFAYVTLSTSNYDEILKGWSTQTVNSFTFHAGGSQYSAGDAAAARSTLESKGWTIIDSGEAP